MVHIERLRMDITNQLEDKMNNDIKMEVVKSVQGFDNYKFDGKLTDEIREYLHVNGYIWSKRNQCYYPASNEAKLNNKNFTEELREEFFPTEIVAEDITEKSNGAVLLEELILELKSQINLQNERIRSLETKITELNDNKIKESIIPEIETVESATESLQTKNEENYDSISDLIIQYALEQSGSGFNYHISFEEVAKLLNKSFSWVKEYQEVINNALSVHNDNELLDYYGTENGPNEFNLYFCSYDPNDEGVNQLFKKENGRWVRKSDEELEKEKELEVKPVLNQFEDHNNGVEQANGEETESLVKEDEEVEVTPEELEIAKSVLPVGQYITTLNLSQGEEGNFFKQKVKDIAAAVSNAPRIGDTDGMEQHPIVLRYFHPTGTESFICEIGNGEAFGYQVLNGNYEMAEFGYIDIEELKSISMMQIDYHIPVGMSIEQYLYNENPEYYSDYAKYVEKGNEEEKDIQKKYVFDNENYENSDSAHKNDDEIIKNDKDISWNELISFFSNNIHEVNSSVESIRSEVENEGDYNEFTAKLETVRRALMNNFSWSLYDDRYHIFNEYSSRILDEKWDFVDEIGQGIVTGEIQTFENAQIILNDKLLNSELYSEVQKSHSRNIATSNYVLNKISAAGIEICKNEEEYESIKAHIEKNNIITQKLTMDWISERKINYSSVTHPADIIPLLNNYNKNPQEMFLTVSLDSQHKPISCRIVSVGTLNNTLVHARDVFREAIKDNAAAVIISHNHPSGNISPSDADVKTTEKLINAGNIIGIDVLDHIITSSDKNEYFSFLEHNMIQKMVNKGVTYGFVYDDKIYLNPNLLNSEVAVHEYTHLWDAYTQRTNPELWEKGKDLFKQTYLWKDILNNPDYKDIANDENLVLSECHARISGKIASEILDRIAKENGNDLSNAVIDWDKEVFEYCQNEFGFANKEFADFISMTLKDLIEGKNIQLQKELKKQFESSNEEITFSYDEFPEEKFANLINKYNSSIAIGRDGDGEYFGRIKSGKVHTDIHIRDNGIALEHYYPKDGAYYGTYEGKNGEFDYESYPGFLLREEALKDIDINNCSYEDFISFITKECIESMKDNEEVYEAAKGSLVSWEDIADSKNQVTKPKIYSYEPYGHEGSIVSVETDFKQGIPNYVIAGISEAAIRETRAIIKNAISEAGLEFPDKRVVQIVSPAGLKKEGTTESLAMAVSILNEQKPYKSDNILILGNLNFSGNIIPVNSVFAAVSLARNSGINKVIVPEMNKAEALSVTGVEVLGVSSLSDLDQKLRDNVPFENSLRSSIEEDRIEFDEEAIKEIIDMNLDGYYDSARAIEIAIAGKHNIIMSGAPGCGKTLLMQNLIPALTPKLTNQEAESATRIYSIAGLLKPQEGLRKKSPFRMPHQTASIEGMCGGGEKCMPGEISLAHNGTLFLDEAAEFKSSVLQLLRVPLENHSITLSRAGRHTVYPAKFQLAMAMNPCPCGNLGSKDKLCLCSAKSIESYWKKISDPVIERIEIKQTVEKNETDERHITVSDMQKHIENAYRIQRENGYYNSKLTPQQILDKCILDEECKVFFDGIKEKYSLHTQSNMLRTALTIANMDNRKEIQLNDLRESVEYVAPISEKPKEYKRESPNNEILEKEVDHIESVVSTGVHHTNKQMIEIREQCRTIIAKPDSEITDDDKLILAQYEGGGGLNEKNRSTSAILNEFYTPNNLIEKVWEIVDYYAPEAVTVLEPSAGTGRFAENRPKNQFTMHELDETSARINKILHPDANIIQGSYQKQFFDEGGRVLNPNYKQPKYDVVIGNPPYGDNNNEWTGRGEGKGFNRIEEYFIAKGLDALKDDYSLLAYVVPSSFINTKADISKFSIAARGKLVDAYRLPVGVFPTTDVGTDIVVFKKYNENDLKNGITNERGLTIPAGDIAMADEFSNGTWFKNHPEKILGQEISSNNQWGNVITKIIPHEGLTIQDELNKITTFVKNIKAVDNVIDAEFETKTDIKEKDKSVEVSSTEEKKDKTKVKERFSYKKSKGDVMSSEEFSHLYGKNFDEREFPIWKATSWNGVINLSLLDYDSVSYLEKSGNYVQVKPGEWQHKVLYATGDIYQKIEEQENYLNEAISKNNGEDEKLHRKNIEILRASLKPQLDMDRIHFALNSQLAEDFIISHYREDGSIEELDLVDSFVLWAQNRTIDTQESRWQIDFSTANISRDDFPENVSWHDIIDFIEGKSVKADKTSSFSYGKTHEEIKQLKAERKKEADLRRQARSDTANALFDKFLHNGLSPETRVKLEHEYNRRFNSYVIPDYSKLPLFVDGMSAYKGNVKFKLYPQQIKGVSFLSNKGNGLLAYDVGVGKTAAGIVATVNQIQSGRSSRPLIVVPNQVYNKWMIDIKQLFPNIPVNDLYNLGERYANPYRDSKNLHKLNIPEGSISLCTYEALKHITFTDESCEHELYEDFSNLLSVDMDGTAFENAKDVGKIQAVIGASSHVNDTKYYFYEDCGFDNLTVDEAHNFKNLWVVPKPKNKGESNEYSGIPSGKPSMRALKMYAMTQITQRKNDNRNVFMLTATPFTNSPLEVYSMLSYIGRERLKEAGIGSLRSFLNEFSKTKYELGVSSKGEIESKQVMKNWKQLPALQNILTEFIDKVDGEEAGIIRPYKNTHVNKLEMNDVQKALREYDERRMAEIKAGNSAAVIVAMNNMRLACVAPALANPAMYPEIAEIIPPMEKLVETSPKLKFVCDSVIDMYKDGNQDKGQFIYVPLGMESHGLIKDYLVKNGLPKDSIEIINGELNNTPEKKELITSKFNDPKEKLKIIIGGKNTSEGIDLNGNSFVMYNCSLGWNPSETIQAEGRIWRQGNEQGTVHVVYPLMYDSIDSVLYQKHDEKRSRINELWTYKDADELNVEDIDPESLKIELIKDPQKRAKLYLDELSKDTKQELSKINLKITSIDEIIESRVQVKRNVDMYKSEVNEYQSWIDESERKGDEPAIWWKTSLASTKKHLKYEEDKLNNIQEKLENLGIKSYEEEAQYINMLNVQKHSFEEKLEKIQNELPQYIQKMKIENAEKTFTEPPLKKQRELLEADILNNLQPMSITKNEVMNIRHGKMLDEMLSRHEISKEEHQLFLTAGWQNYERFKNGELSSLDEFISEKVASEVKVEKENSTSSANYVQGFFNFDIVDDTPKTKVEVSKENRSSELMEKIEEEKTQQSITKKIRTSNSY